MANPCDIDILICTESEQEADRLEEILNEPIKEGWKENKGIYLGSTDRYFFDVDMEKNDNDIHLTCWVKWGLNYTEAEDVIKFFRSILNKIKTFICIHYEEMGFSLYGEYVYDGRTLVNTYLDENDFPIYKEEDNDTFYDELEYNFKHKGIGVLVHDYTKDYDDEEN